MTIATTDQMDQGNITTIHSQTGSVLIIQGLCQHSAGDCIAITMVYALLIVIGVFLNGCVCYVMVRSKRYSKNMSSYMITHMSGVEIVYRVFLTAPLIYTSIPSSGNRSSIPCKITHFVSNACGAAIFGSLVAIAVDRYRNIVHPLAALRHKKRRPFHVVLVVWFYSVVSSFLFLYTAQQVPLYLLPEGKGIQNHGNSTSCDIVPGFLGGLSVTVAVVMTFVVPLATLIITYTAIFVSLRRRCQSGLVHKAAAKSKAKAARMLVIVVSGFVVCWAPYITMTTVRSFDGLRDTSIGTIVVVSIVSNVLVCFSSLMNPLVYAFYSAGFKNDFIRIFVCRRHSMPSSANQKITPSTSETTTRL